MDKGSDYDRSKQRDSKRKHRLLICLGGSTKGKNSKANDAFAQLLSSLNTPVKGKKSLIQKEKKSLTVKLKKTFR